MVCRHEWLIDKRKAVAGKNAEQHIHRGGQRGNARASWSQMISSMTGLIQGLLNLSHFRNRKIFVGAKKVEDRDVASWSSIMSGRN